MKPRRGTTVDDGLQLLEQMRNDITRLKSANSWDDRGSSPATPTSKKSGSSPATPPSKKSMVDADVTPESLRRKGYAYGAEGMPEGVTPKEQRLSTPQFVPTGSWSSTSTAVPSAKLNGRTSGVCRSTLRCSRRMVSDVRARVCVPRLRIR